MDEKSMAVIMKYTEKMHYIQLQLWRQHEFKVGKYVLCLHNVMYMTLNHN